MLSMLMGDTWRTESFHLLLNISHTDEIQLFMRKTLSKTSYVHPKKLARMNITEPYIEFDDEEEDKFVCPPMRL